MLTATTCDIEIQVATHFAAEHSVPFTEEYLFGYHVRITNHGSTAIQVMAREWHIHDGLANKRLVEGAGLVGKQPHIPPGHTFEYVSYCNLKYPFGKMHGRFFAIRKSDAQVLALEVPSFTMLLPVLLN